MAEVVILELLKAEKSTVQKGERKRGSGVQKTIRTRMPKMPKMPKCATTNAVSHRSWPKK